jgi:hypothetical protein
MRAASAARMFLVDQWEGIPPRFMSDGHNIHIKMNILICYLNNLFPSRLDYSCALH